MMYNTETMHDTRITKGSKYYEQFDLKDYQYWTLRLEEHQRYLGQSLVWLKREGEMQRLSSLTEAERNELWSIVLPEYEKAMAGLWQPDHMNYTWLGNLFHLHKGHGHLHLIPRYKTPRTFAGEEFLDTRWGNDYVPYPREAASLGLILAIRDILKAQLG